MTSLLILTVGTGTAGKHSDVAQGLAITIRRVRLMPRGYSLPPCRAVAVADLPALPVKAVQPRSIAQSQIRNRKSQIKNVLIRVQPHHPWLKPSCPMKPSPDITWKIAADPVMLSRDELWARYDHLNMPEKFEVVGGKLFWNEEQRLHVLAMLLEAVGLRRALTLCSPEAVRAALNVAAVGRPNPKS